MQFLQPALFQRPIGDLLEARRFGVWFEDDETRKHVTFPSPERRMMCWATAKG